MPAIPAASSQNDDAPKPQSSDIETSGDSCRSVLIAGCGYVGHRAARAWTARGITVWAITRNEAKAEQLRSEGIRPIVLNLGSGDEWPALPDVDVVLWSVGFERSPTSARSSSEDRHATWIAGLNRLLGSLPERSSPRRILYTSSTGVYGDGDGQDVDEQTAVNPQSEGGVACVKAEGILHGYARRLATGQPTNDHVYILRLAGIYGPDRLLRRVAELRAGTPLTSEPDDWLNLIHVDDAVRMIDYLATINPPAVWNDGPTDQPTSGARVMNVAAAISVTRRTYYSILAELVSAPAPAFAASDNGESASSSHRGRGGNRRVVSQVRSQLSVEFQYDDCMAGLSHAVRESQTSVNRN